MPSDVVLTILVPLFHTWLPVIVAVNLFLATTRLVIARRDALHWAATPEGEVVLDGFGRPADREMTRLIDAEALEARGHQAGRAMTRLGNAVLLVALALLGRQFAQDMSVGQFEHVWLIGAMTGMVIVASLFVRRIGPWWGRRLIAIHEQQAI